MKRWIYILPLVVLWLIPQDSGASVAAQAEPVSEAAAEESALTVEEKSGTPIDVKEIIFGHLKDSYEWHIITVGEKEIAIYLPVILHSKETGWHFFMSDKLKQKGGYDGFYICSTGNYSGKIVERDSMGMEVRPLDLSLTKVALGIVINSILLLIIVMLCAGWYKHHEPTDTPPRGFVGLFELVSVMIIDDVIRPAIGREYKRFTPLLLSLFFFIFLSNLMGLVPIFPGGANVTGNIAVTLTLALTTFVTVNVLGTKEYWKEILWPDVPTFLKCPVPLMPIIEFFGIFTKPFSLTVRLFANMTAGHSVILALTCVIFITANIGPLIGTPMSVVSIVFMIFMNCLELLVAYIQAYVFTMLSSMFIGMSRVRENDNESTK